MLLRVGLAVAPILFGIDKFFNVLADWDKYLAPWINRILPGTTSDVMYLVGVVEIAAGVAVALKLRYGAYIVAAWLAGIVVNLLSYSGYYDIALRDFGLMLAALTLARLASKFDCQGSAYGPSFSLRRIRRRRLQPGGASATRCSAKQPADATREGRE